MGTRRKKSGAGTVTEAVSEAAPATAPTPNPLFDAQGRPIPPGSSQKDMPDVQTLINNLRRFGLGNAVDQLLRMTRNADVNTALRDVARDQRDEYLQEISGTIPPSISLLPTLNNYFQAVRSTANSENYRQMEDEANKLVDLLSSGRIEIRNRMSNNPFVYTFEPSDRKIVSETVRNLTNLYQSLRTSNQELARAERQTATRTDDREEFQTIEDFFRWRQRALVRQIEAYEADLQRRFVTPVL